MVSGRQNLRTLYLWLALAFAVSVALRLALFDVHASIRNIEAAYHVLFTVLAYDHTPIVQHAFLPLNSFGTPMDKGIMWGATWAGPHGNYYYASFPPAGFVVPYLWFKLLGTDPTLPGLLWLNLVIHATSAGLMALLLWRALPEISARWVATLCGGLFYLFANEALYSHGAVYWHHSLFQPVWLLQLLAFQTLLRERTAPRRFTLTLLAATSLLAPMIEWAGYLTTFIIAALAWRNKEIRAAAFPVVLGAAGLALLLYLLHYVAILGLPTLAEALGLRFKERSLASSYTPLQMQISLFWRGYLESYGLPGIIAGLLALREIALWRKSEKQGTPFRLLLVATAFPLIENLVLMQHVVSYSFDRLKALPTMILLLGYYAAAISRTGWRRGFIALWLLGILGNAALFATQKRVTPLHQHFIESRETLDLTRPYQKPCIVYAVEQWVRGWASLNLRHGAYENITTPTQLMNLVKMRGACGAIWLRGKMSDEVIYRWTDAVIYDAIDGSFISARTGRPMSESGNQ